MIKLSHAQKYYNRNRGNEIHAMRDISLELPDAGMVAVCGQSGCGKTTLLNTIGGLDRLNSGSITLFGKNIKRRTDYLRNKYVGYIFQNYNLSKELTVYENVAAALRLCGIKNQAETDERVMAALANVGMERFRNRQPDTLSGGQQQRVAIARAIVKCPQIILADEPTGNLDEQNTVLVMNILKQLSKSCLVLLVTHETNLAELYCDRIINIVDGGVQQDRVNENANGYVGRSKNNIYLGELERSEHSADGLTVEYYGKPLGEIKLKIVNANGRLFLKSNTPALKILDSTSEVKLLEGSFVPDEGEHKAADARTIDMSKLTPVQGKHYGKLFSAGSALSAGFYATFSKSKKKGRGLLRVSMAMLALVAVFMSSAFAVSLRDIKQLRDGHNFNLFYLPLTSETDGSYIYNSIGANGIDYARIINGGYSESFSPSEYFSFKVGNFVTAAQLYVSAQANVLDSRLASTLPLLCGTLETQKPLDAVITSAFADELIASSPASFVGEYEDLLNMVSSYAYDGNNYIRVVGVVQSSERNLYLRSIYATYVILNNVYYNELPLLPSAFDTIHTGDVNSGEIALLSVKPGYSAGDTLNILGKTYTVTQIVKMYTEMSDYAAYVKATYKLKLKSVDDYFMSKAMYDYSADYTRISAEWFFSYYAKYFPSFLDRCLNLNFSAWMYANGGGIEHYIAAMSELSGMNASDMYACYRYKQSYGRYPTEKQLTAYLKTNGEKLGSDYKAVLDDDYNANWAAYDEYTWKRASAENTFIMNDDDYTALAYTAGATDTDVYPYELYEQWQMYDDTTAYSRYMLIHADNAAEAEEYLSAAYGELLITPQESFEKKLDSSRASIIGNLVSLAVVFALICVCIYFIMRASMMSRIKEVGIYRAIGVTKRNLSFRFMVEALVLSTCTLALGYAAAAIAVTKLSAVSYLSSMFYFPTWLCIGLLVLIYLVVILFGTLPIRSLLRKTPSAILAKYDI